MAQQFYSKYDPTLSLGQTDWFESPNFAEEVRVTWGQLKRFENEIAEMKFFRAQTCWLDGTQQDMRDRRGGTLAMARGIINERDLPSGEIARIWPMLGVETCSTRLANAICQAYVTPPVRTFSDDEPINSGYTELYERLEVDEIFDAAYRAALFVNTVLIWWTGCDFVVLTPDEFRLFEGDAGLEVWICRREGDGAKQEVRFDVWTKGGVVTHNHEGKVIRQEENRFGRIPGVLLKLRRSLDPYGAGMVEASEINVWSSLIRLFSTRVALNQSFSITFAKNIATLKEGSRIGPGSVLIANNVGGEAGTMPAIEVIDQHGKFEELENFRRKAVNSFERNQGLPGFLVDEGAGQPPTGAALQVMERELNDRRRQHAKALVRAERDFLELVGVLIATEPMFSTRRALLVQGVKLFVKYSAPGTFDDPGKGLEFDLARAAAGLVTAVEIAEKYLGVTFKNEADASAALQENKASLSFMSPTVPTKPTTEPNA